ncbi:sulfotransferase family protein [Micromonospora sp. WMMA1923]|uniref:sulfotransferase family protein n=1 Tax=Micromonospora sp. WMMA1923 TaxID=3404125 RepID=UPI003B9300F5
MTSGDQHAGRPASEPDGPVRVLYLAGSGRSGSTLVTNVLGQYAGVLAAGELRYLWQRGELDNRPCGCGRPFRDCPLWSRVRRDVPVGRAAEIAAGLRGRLRMRGVPALLWRARAGRRAVAAHPDDAVLTGLYTCLARHADARIVVDSSKLPPYGALLDGLPGLDVRVLHVVRDPRATAFSWRRRRGLDGERDQRLMSRPPVWKAALLWSVWNAVTVRLFAADPERYLRIRYEDLTADPAAALARITAFAGLGAQPGPLVAPGAVGEPAAVRLAPTHSVAGNPSRHRTGAVPIRADDQWRTDLSRWSYAVVTALTWPGLRRLGYPLGRTGRTTSTGRRGTPVGVPTGRQEG